MTDDDRSARLLREIFLAGFMSGLPAANVAWAAVRLASAMTDLRLQAGEVLYRKGQPSEDHFFVVEGEMKLETEDAPPWTFAERSLIGTIDLLLDRPRSRTATATKPAHLLRMAGQDWLDMLEDNFELTRSAVNGLSRAINELHIALGPVGPASALPPANNLLGKIGLIDRIFTLRAVSLFTQADVQALTNLAVLAEEVSFAPGELLLERGATNDAMFVLMIGEVSASRAPSAHRETFGPGELVFGPSAAAGANAAYEARAVVATRALRIACEDYLDVMEEHFELARSSLRAVSLEREMLMNERGRRETKPAA